MEAVGLSADPSDRRGDQPIRAAELVGALSLATDIGAGQPLEHALRTAVLAVRLGELVGPLVRSSSTRTTWHSSTRLAAPPTGTRRRSSSARTSSTHRAAFFLIDPSDPEQVLAF